MRRLFVGEVIEPQFERSIIMATTYVRRFNLKDSLSDADVVTYWKFLMEEFVPVLQKGKGVRSVKLYSSAGALRADLRITLDMDDAGVYERLLVDPAIRKHLGTFYGAIDLKTSSQTFFREVTPELIRALSSVG
jgi:hypothetical protein